MGKVRLGAPDGKALSPTSVPIYLPMDCEKHELLQEESNERRRRALARRKCWTGWLIGLTSLLLITAIILISINFCLKQKDIGEIWQSYHSGPAGQVGPSTTKEPTTVPDVADHPPKFAEVEDDIHVSKDSGNESEEDNDMSSEPNEDQPSSSIAPDSSQLPQSMLDIFKEFVNGANSGKFAPLSSFDKDRTTNSESSTSSPNYYESGDHYYDEDDDEDGIWFDNYGDYQYETTPETATWFNADKYDYDYEDDKSENSLGLTTTVNTPTFPQDYVNDYYYDDDEDVEGSGGPELMTIWPQYNEGSNDGENSMWHDDSSYDDEQVAKYDDYPWDMTTPESFSWSSGQNWNDFDDIWSQIPDYATMGMNITHFANILANHGQRVMDIATSFDGKSFPGLDTQFDKTDDHDLSHTTEEVYTDLAGVTTSLEQKLASGSDQEERYDDYEPGTVTASADDEGSYHYPESYYYYEDYYK